MPIGKDSIQKRVAKTPAEKPAQETAVKAGEKSPAKKPFSKSISTGLKYEPNAHIFKLIGFIKKLPFKIFLIISLKESLHKII